MLWPWDLRTRSLEPELLDHERPPREMMERVVGFLSAVNRYLGGAATIAPRLPRGGAPFRVLDVAAGAGDVLRDLVRRVPGLRPLALDFSPDMLEFATGLPRIRGDAFRLPFRDRSVDWVITTLFFHHLTDLQVVAVLREFDRVARRGIVVNDLLRRWRAWAWTKLLTLPANPIVQVDGPLSIRKAFREDEILALARAAGLPWLRLRRHFGHRFTLAGERPDGA